jgi:cellulose synthase/poly-beta-1,6-N-acetylglucosamine synthase-like glycosyltransferase
MGALAALVLAPVAAVAAAMAVYLLGLSAAAFYAPQAPPPAGPRRRRFAVLVPAHNEASVIERLLGSLGEQRYPRGGFDVHVVADNCTDDTADLARARGSVVHERTDPQQRAKGYALRWVLERLRGGEPYDAYVVFDADSVASPDFLARMDDRLEAGSLAIQAHYTVLNADASPVAALREAALASLHYLRPLGRSALGLSAGLKGNGMCFEAAMLDRAGWASVGLAEDVELHLALVRDGIRVDFCPEAIVRADMPATFSEARSQNLRWEAGRIAALRNDVLPLLRRGIARREWMLVDAAAEQLVPPLSVAVSVSGACAVAAAALGSPIVAALAAFGAAGFALHIVAGLAAVGAPARTYVALLRAPAYVAWKLALYARAAVAPSSLPWVRTQRPG